MGHCQSRCPDGSFDEQNIASPWELSLVEDFLFLNLHLRVCVLSLSEQGKHVLVFPQASAWISATKFGCKINASFDNVRILWFLKSFRVCATWVGCLFHKICFLCAFQYILWKIVNLWVPALSDKLGKRLESPVAQICMPISISYIHTCRWCCFEAIVSFYSLKPLTRLL